MRALLFALVLGAAGLVTATASGAARDEVRATYEQFVAAQNARDLDRVRSLLADSPDLLWVSDGRSFWGRDVVIARMASFQRAETWRAVPDLDRAAFVAVTDQSAYLHMPLLLQIGERGGPVNDTRFLVSILFTRASGAWRIAALFTTLQNTD